MPFYGVNLHENESSPIHDQSWIWGVGNRRRLPVLADVDTAKCSKHGGIIIKLNKKENMENWKNNTGELLT